MARSVNPDYDLSLIGEQNSTPIPNVNPVPARPEPRDYSMTKWFESDNKPHIVNGNAYGSYQMDMVGVLPHFTKTYGKDLGYLGQRIGSPAYRKWWVEGAKNNPIGWQQKEDEYMDKFVFGPALEYAKSKGLDINNKGMMNTIVDMANQHGGYKKIIDTAVTKIKPGSNIQDGINILWDERIAYLKSLKHLSAKKKQEIIRDRYIKGKLIAQSISVPAEAGTAQAYEINNGGGGMANGTNVQWDERQNNLDERMAVGAREEGKVSDPLLGKRGAIPLDYTMLEAARRTGRAAIPMATSAAGMAVGALAGGAVGTPTVFGTVPGAITGGAIGGTFGYQQGRKITKSLLGPDISEETSPTPNTAIPTKSYDSSNDVGMGNQPLPKGVKQETPQETKGHIAIKDFDTSFNSFEKDIAGKSIEQLQRYKMGIENGTIKVDRMEWDVINNRIVELQQERLGERAFPGTPYDIYKSNVAPSGNDVFQGYAKDEQTGTYYKIPAGSNAGGRQANQEGEDRSGIPREFLVNTWNKLQDYLNGVGSWKRKDALMAQQAIELAYKGMGVGPDIEGRQALTGLTQKQTSEPIIIDNNGRKYAISLDSKGKQSVIGMDDTTGTTQMKLNQQLIGAGRYERDNQAKYLKEWKSYYDNWTPPTGVTKNWDNFLEDPNNITFKNAWNAITLRGGQDTTQAINYLEGGS